MEDTLGSVESRLPAVARQQRIPIGAVGLLGTIDVPGFFGTHLGVGMNAQASWRLGAAL